MELRVEPGGSHTLGKHRSLYFTFFPIPFYLEQAFSESPKLDLNFSCSALKGLQFVILTPEVVGIKRSVAPGWAESNRNRED